VAGTQEFTTVQVNGRNYRIGLIKADVGARLIHKIMFTLNGEKNQEKAKAVACGLGGLSTEDDALMQKELLSVVSYETQVGDNVNYIPLFDGEHIFDPSIANNPNAFYILQQASYNVNLLPFFAEENWNAMKSAIQETVNYQ